MKRTRLFLLFSVTIALVFWWGYIVGSSDYKHEVANCIIKGETKEAIKMCYAAQSKGADVVKDPLYFTAIAASLAKRGDMEGVIFNINKVAELLGKK